MELDFVAGLIFHRENAAERDFEDPFSSVGVNESRNSAIGLVLIQEHPRVLTFFFVAQHARKTELTLLYERFGNAEQPRGKGLVEVEATGIVARLKSEGLDVLNAVHDIVLDAKVGLDRSIREALVERH